MEEKEAIQLELKLRKEASQLEAKLRKEEMQESINRLINLDNTVKSMLKNPNKVAILNILKLNIVKMFDKM